MATTDTVQCKFTVKEGDKAPLLAIEFLGDTPVTLTGLHLYLSLKSGSDIIAAQELARQLNQKIDRLSVLRLMPLENLA